MTRARHVPFYTLTEVERLAHADRERERAAEAQCSQCVNGFQVWQRWTCDADLEWPRCKNVNGGYEKKI